MGIATPAIKIGALKLTQGAADGCAAATHVSRIRVTDADLRASYDSSLRRVNIFCQHFQEERA